MRYFITSDIHSFYIPLMDALTQAGFDIANPEHILVVDGDLFDRGPHSVNVYNFIKQLPKERRVLIRGNHEYLLRELICDKWQPESYDYSNGTVRTCVDLYLARHPYSQFRKLMKTIANDEFGGISIAELYTDSWLYTRALYASMYDAFWNRVKNDIQKSGIIDWIFSDEWVDYFEMGNYIIVHSFIPLEIPMVKKWGEFFLAGDPKYMPNWRKCKDKTAWDRANWGCPYEQFDEGYFKKEAKKGKILVCGHWHCSDFHLHYERDLQTRYSIKHAREDYTLDINKTYYGDNLIALDACTVLSGFCNILVIDDKDYIAYDKSGNKLTKELSESNIISRYPYKVETVTESQLLEKRDKEEGLT